MQDSRLEIKTDRAPAPAGTYGQAIVASGLLWIAGHTPRSPDGTRITGSFEQQARQTLDNVEAIARAAGTALRAAVKVNVYLRDTDKRAEFDKTVNPTSGNSATSGLTRS